MLPFGQRARPTFPRFGLPEYANREGRIPKEISLSIGGKVSKPGSLSRADLLSLPRVRQVSDFHCVTTWSYLDCNWGGWRFADLVDMVQPDPNVHFVYFRSWDGYRTILPLADAVASDVLLADELDGSPLTLAHGAPLRLVAPAHYGYKNPKHLRAIEFHPDTSRCRSPMYRFMEHSRARVAQEERGRGVPGWLLRFLYRPLINSTIRDIEKITSAAGSE